MILHERICAGRFLNEDRGRVGCAEGRRRSSWDRTSRCTIRERCRKCCRGRRRWERNARRARVRFASEWSNPGEIAAKCCPRGNRFVRGRRGRLVPTRLRWKGGRGG